MQRAPSTLLVLAILAAAPAAQAVHYDEAAVPAYELPPLLVAADGSAVADAETWRTVRRPELLRRFAEDVYGVTPPGAGAAKVRVEVLEDAVPALDGAALRTQVRLAFERGGRTLELALLLFVPAAAEAPVPAFLVANFFGNHSIHPDTGIRLASAWLAERQGLGVVDHRATADGRGVRASRFPVEAILARGYALATFCYNDVDPDFDDGFANGAHALFDEALEGERAPNAWGAIGAWAWGYSRALDQLEREPQVDGARVAVLGHSRLGKTALWAGAQDERFALVISNESGCGGAALWRRRFGETLERITTRFPHWFCDALDPFAGRENALSVDQHQLLALVAPRPLYVASAVEDRWTDPRGELLAAHHASPAWGLFGREGLDATALPSLGRSIGAHVGYHVRAGAHDLRREDWEHFLAFADRHLESDAEEGR